MVDWYLHIGTLQSVSFCAGEANKAEHQRCQGIEQKDLSCAPCQQKGKGNHHRNHTADVVGVAPAGIDQSCEDLAVTDHLVGDKNYDKLETDSQPGTQTNPAQIFCLHALPIHSTGKQPVQQTYRDKLQQSKNRVHNTVFKITPAESAGKQIACAQEQHTGQ